MSLHIKRSGIIGQGLFTDSRIKKGSLVGVIKGPIIVDRIVENQRLDDTFDWIGVGRYSWINTDKSIFKYINHACDPNTYIKGKRLVIALKDIAAGEEVTMDYSLTEAGEYTLPGGCRCKAKNCRKSVGPIYSLNRAEYNKRKHLVGEKFRRVYEVEQKRNHR